jgi:hypothetical protein
MSTKKEIRKRFKESQAAKRLARTSHQNILKQLANHGLLDQFNTLMEQQKTLSTSSSTSTPTSAPPPAITRDSMVKKLTDEGRFNPTPETIRTIFERLQNTQFTIPPEQADKMRAMIIVYQRAHPEDRLTTEWSKVCIRPDEVLVQAAFVSSTADPSNLSDLSDLSSDLSDLSESEETDQKSNV